MDDLYSYVWELMGCCGMCFLEYEDSRIGYDRSVRKQAMRRVSTACWIGRTKVPSNQPCDRSINRIQVLEVYNNDYTVR